MARLHNERKVEREIVAGRDQRCFVDTPRAEFFFHRGRSRKFVRIDDLHAEAAPAPRDCLADAPEAGDAERAAGEITAQKAHHLPAVKAPLPNVTIRREHAPRSREQQREREVRGRVGQDARRVGNGDTVARGGGHVDVVVADGNVGDDFEPRTAR